MLRNPLGSSLALFAIIAVAGAPRLDAVSVCLGASLVTGCNMGTVIQDNMPFDLDNAVNVIRFDTVASGIMRNYPMQGTVRLGAGGALVGIGGARIVRLTEFVARNDGIANGGIEMVSFGHIFQFGQQAPGVGDGIVGVFDNTGGGATAATTQLTSWQGYLNGLPIGANYAPAATGGNALVQFGNSNNIAGVAFPPPYSLVGVVSFRLDQLNDRLSLPNSAEVGVATIPEPSPLMLLSSCLAILALCRLAKRRRGPERAPGEPEDGRSRTVS